MAEYDAIRKHSGHHPRTAAHDGIADGTRLEAEMGYGLPVGSRFVGTPRVGVGTSEMGRDYRLG